MTAKRTRSQVGLEHLQIAHKIAELNKAYGAIPRGAQGSNSVGREIAKLVKRQADLQAELDVQPGNEVAPG
jgi:hypothetical protein